MCNIDNFTIQNIFFLYVDTDPDSRNSLTVYISNQEFINHNMDDYLERESFNEIIIRYSKIFYKKFMHLYPNNITMNNYQRYLNAIVNNVILPDKYSESFNNYLNSVDFWDFIEKK